MNKKSPATLKHFIWRGISMIAPPLVTLLVLIWLFNAIEQYVLAPLETGVRSTLVMLMSDVFDEAPAGSKPKDPLKPEAGFTFEGFNYVRPHIGRRFIPEHIITYVDANQEYLPKDMQRPLSAHDYYASYVKLRYMPRSFTIPLLLLLVLCGLFFLGRFFAAGVGRFIFNAFETLINQVPFVSNVYSSVKQVTDFVLSDRDMEFTRVVAVEYPRKDIWSVGFVTGAGLPGLEKETGEDLVAVFLPCSPMPMTGYTINIARKSVIDLDMSIDQAIQFMVSCGVVSPVDRSVIEGAKAANSGMLTDKSQPS
ncbi:MAG: DUF502 domain-containing protein [Pirellulales bacterium]